MTDPKIQELRPLEQSNGFDITPKTFEQALQFADMVAESDMVPKDFKNKPGNCLIAMQMGTELGIPPLQALQNIAVVNGRPAVWGDLLPAIAQGHASFEYLNETFDEKTMTATCVAKRKNQPEQIRTFSQRDAETAGLWGRNTWKQYPKRMLQMRARGFAVRDVWPDAMKGVSVAEDYIDLDPKDYSVVGSETIPTKGDVALISNEQALQIDAYISENGLDKDKWKEYLNKNIGISEFDQMPADKYDAFIAMMVKAVNAKKEASQSEPINAENEAPR